jgi:hypothetical protein
MLTWTYNLDQLPGDLEEVLVVAQIVGSDDATVMLARLDWIDVSETERSQQWVSTFKGDVIGPNLRIYGWARYATPLLPPELQALPAEENKGEF